MVIRFLLVEEQRAESGALGTSSQPSRLTSTSPPVMVGVTVLPWIGVPPPPPIILTFLPVAGLAVSALNRGPAWACFLWFHLLQVRFPSLLLTHLQKCGGRDAKPGLGECSHSQA